MGGYKRNASLLGFVGSKFLIPSVTITAATLKILPSSSGTDILPSRNQDHISVYISRCIPILLMPRLVYFGDKGQTSGRADGASACDVRAQYESSVRCLY